MLSTYLNDYENKKPDINKIKISQSKLLKSNSTNKEEEYIKQIEYLKVIINNEREQKIISDMEFTQQIATIINGMIKEMLDTENKFNQEKIVYQNEIEALKSTLEMNKTAFVIVSPPSLPTKIPLFTMSTPLKTENSESDYNSDDFEYLKI